MIRAKFVLILLVLPSFFACSEKPGNPGKKEILPISDAKQPKILFFAQGSESEVSEYKNGYHHSAMEGILNYYGDSWVRQEKRGVFYDVIYNETLEDRLPNLIKYCKTGKWDLLITSGIYYAQYVKAAAAEFPAQKFAVIDVGWIDMPNVRQYTFDVAEGSYLVGVIAALRAMADGLKDPVFGFIGGIPSGSITEFEIGYVQGIYSVYKNAKIVDYYVNAWSDQEAARAKAKEWYADGVYAIYSAAGASGLGTVRQAREERKNGKNVWAIGVDIDQYDEGLYGEAQSAVLTSMLKQVGAATTDAATSIQTKTFSGGAPVDLDLAHGGVDYTTSNRNAITKEISAQAEKIKKDIINEQITVYRTYHDALVNNVAPQGLLAIDD